MSPSPIPFVTPVVRELPPPPAEPAGDRGW
jgi:hypothetical protein